MSRQCSLGKINQQLKSLIYARNKGKKNPSCEGLLVFMSVISC